jgi:hypothetical protein
VVGYNLLPSRGGPGGGPTPTPSSSPAPSPSTTPAASTSIIFPSAGPLEPGRYTLTEDDTVFSIQVPDGWHSSGLNCSMCGGWLQRGADDATDPSAVWMPVWNVDGVATDPCGQTAAPPATSASELAAGVAAIPGTDVITAPEDVTVGGRPAKHVVIKVPEDIGCAPRAFSMWYDDSFGSNVFRWATALGQTNRVWIVDIDGKRFWIEAETYKGSTPKLEQEIETMIDSIQFE